MNNGSLKNRQQGMTLIEIMVALMLGAFLLAGVMQIFLSSKQTYRMQDNLSRMQENGRFAMEFITRDIRVADYKVCFSDTSIGGEVSGTNNLGLNGSDRITVLQKDDACGVGISANTFSAITFSIQADAGGQPALFKTTATGSTVPVATANLTAVGMFVTQALVEGIENMQILYGEDTDADNTPDYYVDAATVVDMNNVVSVRVSLLVTSIDDNLIPQPRTYIYNGVSTTPIDRRIRKVFTSTIVLRNRL